jgi:hypothetical protein
MKSITLHPGSLVAGAVFALLLLVAMGQKPVAGDAWEYQVVTDVDDKDAAKLAEEEWSYVGYLGVSKLGSGTDETLWRRPKK